MCSLCCGVQACEILGSHPGPGPLSAALEGCLHHCTTVEVLKVRVLNDCDLFLFLFFEEALKGTHILLFFFIGKLYFNKLFKLAIET